MIRYIDEFWDRPFEGRHVWSAFFLGCVITHVIHINL